MKTDEGIIEAMAKERIGKGDRCWITEDADYKMSVACIKTDNKPEGAREARATRKTEVGDTALFQLIKEESDE